MEIKIKYIAFDGTEFDNENACLEYESDCSITTKSIIEVALMIKKYCMAKNCDYCPFENVKDATGTICTFRQASPCFWEFDKIVDKK